MKWEKEEDNLLTMEYNQGLSISLMMKNHQRFRKEIESRIEELGLDNEPEKECVQSSPFHLNGDALNFDEPRTKIKKNI